MTDAASRPPSNTLLVVAVVGIALFMESLDSTILLTSLPAMARELGVAPVALSVTLTVYLLALGVGAPMSGWLADRLGVRVAFCWALVLFIAASVLCGVAQNLPTLIAGRTLQGLGGAIMVPVGRLAVLRAAPKDQLVRAVNWMAVPWLAAPVVGPAVGGFITDYFDWRWNFFINVPIGLLVLSLSLRYLPQEKAAHRRPFDWIGFLLVGGAMTGVIMGLETASAADGRWVWGAALAVAGAALGAAFLWRSRRMEHPLIPLDAMAIPSFRLAAVSAGSLVRIVLHTPIFVLPLLLQVGFGMRAFAAGLIVLAGAAGDLLVKAVTTVTVRKLGFRTLLLVSGVGFAVLTAAPALFTASTDVRLMFAVLFTYGAVRSLHMTGLSSLQFADVQAAEMTGASTLQWVVQQMARAGGIAVAALMVNLSALTHGGSPEVADFRLALVLSAAALLATCALYWPLPRDAGAHVSGHTPGGRANRSQGD